MTVNDLKERLIAEGIVSVSQEKRPTFRKGGIAGFELCRDLHTADDFVRTLKERRRWEATHGYDVPLAKYWEHAYATAQIEYVFKVLQVAWGWPVLSARAILRYNQIVSGAPSGGGGQ